MNPPAHRNSRGRHRLQRGPAGYFRTPLRLIYRWIFPIDFNLILATPLLSLLSSLPPPSLSLSSPLLSSCPSFAFCLFLFGFLTIVVVVAAVVVVGYSHVAALDGFLRWILEDRMRIG